MKTKKRFFSSHAKSSAAVISLAVHVTLIIVAFSFVAVTVITKADQSFEAKPVSRPRMQLKKLQVPVNIKKKKTQAPRLRKRILVKPRLNQTAPDIKLPEITGVKGGIGSAGDGLGSAGDLGFSMPDIEIFGVKGKGEKVFIALDCSDFMMENDMGGIPAYTIIKSELVRILRELNPTVLFNITVYGGGDHALFPKLVSATEENVDKVEKWLEPLNAVKAGMGDRDYGARTLGPGGVGVSIDTKVDPLRSGVGEWARPTMLAMKQQADIVFILSCRWGHLTYKVGEREQWSESQWARYRDLVAKSKQLLKKENDQLRAKGKPPRVIARGDRGRVRAYFPNAALPPTPKQAKYTPEQMAEAFSNMRKKHKISGMPHKSGLSHSKKKDKFAINVIHFVKKGYGAGNDARFVQLTRLTRGDYRQIEGMAAIKSYVSGQTDD